MEERTKNASGKSTNRKQKENEKLTRPSSRLPSMNRKLRASIGSISRSYEGSNQIDESKVSESQAEEEGEG